MKKIIYYILPAFILIVFFLSLNKENQYDTKALVGEKIINFEINSFENSNKITNEDFLDNSYTLINFWASWCGPCRKEHKYLIMLQKNSNLKIFGINFKDNKKKAENFLRSLSNPYSYIGTDEDGRVSVNFGIYGIPESILINKDQIVLKKYIGPLNKKDYKEILKIIE